MGVPVVVGVEDGDSVCDILVYFGESTIRGVILGKGDMSVALESSIQHSCW